MSKIVIFGAVLLMAAAIFAAPAEDQVEDSEIALERELPLLTEEGEAPSVRITCDLLSGLGWGHTFCAFHCRLLGNKGGYCNSKGVCICRN